MALLAMTIGATRASAAYLHSAPFVSFGPDGTAATVFTETGGSTFKPVGALAFDQARDRLYVLNQRSAQPNNDAKVPRVHGFDVSTPGTYTPLPGFPFGAPSAGTLQNPPIVVDDSPGSSGDVFYNSGGSLLSYTSAGIPRVGFPIGDGHTSGIGVDSAGHIWESDSSTVTLNEYSPSGELLNSVSVANQGNTGNIAIDRSTDDLYMAGHNATIWKYTKASGYKSGTPFGVSTGSNLVFDAAHQILYVLRGAGVDAYNVEGELVERFVTGLGATLSGIAVDESTGTVYVSNQGSGQVMAFPGVVVPDVTTDDPIGKAVVSGHLDPLGGAATSCKFEYLPESAFQTEQGEIQTISISGAGGGTYSLVFSTNFVPKGTGTLTAGSTTVSSLVTDDTFVAGQAISGSGIPPGTTLVAAGDDFLTLSQPATASGSGVALTAADQGRMTGAAGVGTLSAGSETVSSLRAVAGVASFSAGATIINTNATASFAVGQPISGAGIPPGTTVKSVLFFQLELSAATTASGAGVPISGEGPRPFVVGEAISGAGIPDGTTITAAGPGTLTLSQPATASGSGVALNAGLPFDALPATVQAALEELRSIGAGNVEVSGPAGGPYVVKFKGARVGDVAQIRADSSTLTPPGASVTVTTTKSGGMSWNVTPDEAPCSPGPPITEPKDVSATLPGLVPETRYRYRLRAGNANGSIFGLVRSITPHWVDRITTEPASGIDRFSATLNGSFNGTGEDTDYYFEWGTTTSYGEQSPTLSAGTTTGPTPMSFGASGLDPGAVYHYRVVGENANGTSLGEDKTFATLPAVLGIASGDATDLAPHAATLNASFIGTNQDTDYFFEWGTTDLYGQSTAEEGAGTTSGPTSVSAGLSGLELETIYHYRVVAENGSGISFGQDRIFKTPPAVAGVDTLAASDLTLSTVTLNGSFIGNGDATSYYFDWGPTSSYGNRTAVPPGAPAGAPNGATQVSAQLTDFKGFTTYHYRLVATNSEGTTVGPDQTFTTPDALVPSIAQTSSSEVVSSGARVEAQINPNRWETVYLFEYGPSTAYGSATATDGPLDADIAAQSVSAQLSELSPGITYHYRVVAINFAGTGYGPDRTFTTPDRPRVDSSSSSAVGQSSAHLTASVAANGAASTVRFEYGTDGSYGQSTLALPLGADFSPRSAEVDVTGLSPGVTYHFRAVAENGIGTVTGPNQTFTTQAATPPRQEATTKTCRKGFVKRRGKCVKRKKARKPSKRGGNRHG